MSEKNESLNPFDPTGMFKTMRDSGMDAWSKTMIQLVNSEAYAQATATLERERFLFQRLNEPGMSETKLLADFLAPPLHTAVVERNFGTLYTAAYWPAEGAMSLLWPGERLDQSMDSFTEAERPRSYGRGLGERSNG